MTGPITAEAMTLAQNVLDPRGRGADDAAGLLWLLIAVATFVVVLVTVLVVGSALRSWRNVRRGVPRAEGPPPASVEPHRRERAALGLVIGAGLVFPVVAVSGVFAATVGPLRRTTRHDPAALQVQVVAHRWWWEVAYPDEGIVTANEIHIPRGRDVRLTLTSDDVIHSVWVPQLAGKIDAIPGKANHLTLHATDAGVYVGKCGEFCGLQHARMRFQVVVDEPDDFDTWVDDMTTPPDEPTGDALEGREIFLGSACVYCHAVEGTNATSHFGPDLTHLASRRTLAAGMVANNPGNLAGWILDPQSMKPGNLMPPMDIPGDQLQRLLAYLETLE